MGEVLRFRPVGFRPVEDGPHISGNAKCLACKHEFTAVAPVGTTDLTCPECLLERGVWAYPLTPADGKIWQCSCGGFHFFILLNGYMCVSCGRQTEEK